MSLQFITSNTIGPKERRLIRSHVMAGKNAGKSRPSHKKQRDNMSKQISTSEIRRQFNDPYAQNYTQSCSRPRIANRLICNDLAFTQLTQQSAETIERLRQWLSLMDRRLYPVEFCSKLDFMDYVWLQYVFYDEGYMHGVLAIKASFAELTTKHAETSPASLTHLSKAYRFTQKRLDGPNAVSDKAIAAVTILAIYQLVHGHVGVGLVHFNGLCRMIELRGGLGVLLQQNRALAQKPWRIDLEFALQSGLPMRFSTADISCLKASSGRQKDEPKAIHPIYTSLYESGVDRKLVGLLSDVATFVDILNAIDTSSRLDPLDFSERAFSLLHRLIEYAPLGGPRPANGVENILQLGLLAIMTTSLPNYTPEKVGYEMLANQLKSAIQNFSPTTDDERKLVLWAVFVGHVSVMEESEDEWIVALVREICKDLGTCEWMQVRKVLGAYCWIHISHDKAAMKIWGKTRERKD